MQSLILIVHVLTAVFLIILILMQHGQGADAGASFGAGASNTVFGSQGSAPIMMKITACLALVFFITSLSLAYLAAHQVPVKSIADSIDAAKKVAPISQPAPQTSIPLGVDTPQQSIPKQTSPAAVKHHNKQAPATRHPKSGRTSSHSAAGHKASPSKSVTKAKE